MAAYPCLVLQKDGLSLLDALPAAVPAVDVPGVQESFFIHDGADVLVLTPAGVSIINVATRATTPVVAMRNITRIALSPRERFVSVFQSPETVVVAGENGPVRQQTAQEKNVFVFELAAPHRQLFATFQKNVVWPCVTFSVDETVMAHLHTGLTFYDVSADEIKRAPKQFSSLKPSRIAFARNPELPRRFAVFTKPTKDMPASVKVYDYPVFTRVVNSTSFFGASQVDLVWSPAANVVLAKLFSEVDKTNQNYYGESSLQILCGAESALNISHPQLDIHETVFDAAGKRLVVISGSMPATLQVYEITARGKLTLVKELARQSRNEAKFSPNGQFLAVGGFGNLPGELDIYETERWRLVAQFTNQCTTEWWWTHDSKAIVFGSCMPRRHFENYIRVGFVSGETAPSVDFDNKLFHVFLRPLPVVHEPVPFTVCKAQREEVETAYVPPSLRAGAQVVADDDPIPAAPKKKAKTAKQAKKAKKAKKGKQPAEPDDA